MLTIVPSTLLSPIFDFTPLHFCLKWNIMCTYDTVEKFLIPNFNQSNHSGYHHILLYKMWSEPEWWDRLKFDSKNFSTIIKFRKKWMYAITSLYLISKSIFQLLCLSILPVSSILQRLIKLVIVDGLSALSPLLQLGRACEAGTHPNVSSKVRSFCCITNVGFVWPSDSFSFIMLKETKLSAANCSVCS